MDETSQLDCMDRKLLDIIQSDFPLEPRPYALLGNLTGISEQEACNRINRMRNSGLIRRLGANFQSRKLGFVSTLCAAKVPDKELENFIKCVNAESGVTHNYQRLHEYNVWFTLIAPSKEKRDEILENISAKTGIKILSLPAEKMYKIRVDFPMKSEEAG